MMWTEDVSLLDKNRNELLALIQEKLKGNCLRWCGHVMRKNDKHMTKTILSLEAETAKNRPGRSQTTWISQRHMKTMCVDTELTQRHPE